MTLTLSSRPLSHNFGSPSASTPLPGFDYRPQARPTVRSHYRPHSTLFLREQAPNPDLVKSSRRQSLVRRSVSLGETMGLGKKKATEQDVKGKDKPQLPRLHNPAPGATPPPAGPDTRVMVSRPGTAGGLSSIAENGKGSALHRVKARRSIGCLFAASAAAGADVSPDVATPTSEQIHHSPPTHPPSAQRPRKMNVAASSRPRAPSTPRLKRHSREDYENAMNARKRADTNGWVTRSRTTVHPYAKEVPYMQAYDIPCLENDRYTQLLLERLNPGSPTFLEAGKRPQNALDLGCGQGEWCLYAASMWKHTRIVGFDLMDVTLPQFQATENLSFVQGNFLNKLPFPTKSFDYVRMANLSLCIPYTQWLPLLTEARRILTNGGRLELIDDQIMFPYGEEPQVKEATSPTSASDPDPTPIPAPMTPGEEGMDYRAPTLRDPSFFDFGSDSEPDLDEGYQDDDETETSSTTSTLVSDRGSAGFYDKFPSWKRSSAQSTQSTRSYASTTSTLNSERRFSDAPPPIAISTTATPLGLNPIISPSPTVTQATIQALDASTDVGDLSQTPTIRASKKHKKHDSGSSTKSNTDAAVTWKHRKTSSGELETIFEHILIHNYGIHPRPSEFMVDTLSRAFGQGNAGKAKSFHIKLAPFDSPIGPGGAQDPNAIQEQQRVDKKQLKKEKFDKKERKREHRRIESSLEQPYHSAMLQPPVVTAKAASRLGLVPTVPPLPRGGSYETTAGSDGSPISSATSSKRSSTELSPTSAAAFPVVSAKAASRLGIPPTTPPPVPPKSEAIKAAYIYPARASPEVPKPLDATIRLVSSKETQSVEDYFGPMAITPTSSFRESDQIERNSSSSSSGSNGSGSGSGGVSEGEQSSGGSSDVLSDEPLVPPPHVLSAKAAGRLGISYSVLAAASAGHSRAVGVMSPVQSPGLLVWPSTYIATTPAELEMHACKWVQTLLGCRHAMREFITGPFNGEKLVDDDGFEEAIWDYECFRRPRFHWPNDNPELFANAGFPDSPGPNSPNPSRQQSPTSPMQKIHARNDSCESFNGQYRRNELTQARVIRVFEAVKTGDEKGSVVSMLFRG